MSPSSRGATTSANEDGVPRSGAFDAAGTSDAIVRVAAAVIVRADGRVLLAQRPPGKPYAGYWEFPGGKLEPGETARAALARELHEELGITVRRASPWLVQRFVYPHAHVELHFHRVTAWDGDLLGRDGQAFAWQEPGAIAVAPLLPANTRVLAALTLPTTYAITCAGDIGESAFLARTVRALENGVRLIQVREKAWDTTQRDAFARRVAALAAPYRATVLLNGAADDARRLGVQGVHWSAAALSAAHERPRDLVVAASCHTREELRRACALDLDFVVLGPVRATPTHPDASPLGWEGFAATSLGTSVPVFALGGLAPSDSETAMANGAHGIAMRRNAWPRD